MEGCNEFLLSFLFTSSLPLHPFFVLLFPVVKGFLVLRRALYLLEIFFLSLYLAQLVWNLFLKALFSRKRHLMGHVIFEGITSSSAAESQGK